MRNTYLTLMPLSLLVSACMGTVPVAATCPPPPPPLAVEMEPVSTGQTLSERYNALMQGLKLSLTKALLPKSGSTQ